MEKDMTVDDMYDALLDMGVSEQTLQIVADISGYSKQTMLDVLYAGFGYLSFDQVDD